MKKRLRKALTLVGCFSTGIIYGSIGVIAILSFLKLKEGGADEKAFFALLDGFLVGKVIDWAIILGALCFIAWRFYEAFADPYHYGRDPKAIMLRTGAAFSSVADAFVVLSVLQAMFSEKKIPVDGQPVQQRNSVAGLLQTDWGRTALMIMAGLVILTALVLAFYGLSKRFTEAINAAKFSKTKRDFIHAIAYAGYFSRGVILGITGFFLGKAAIEKNSNVVVNTDKAFDFIGDEVGHLPFILVAAGTICYGLYMFILGLNYKVASEKNSG